jgi:hypothetical protein
MWRGLAMRKEKMLDSFIGEFEDDTDLDNTITYKTRSER